MFIYREGGRERERKEERDRKIERGKDWIFVCKFIKDFYFFVFGFSF